jgi:hypothetical protein
MSDTTVRFGIVEPSADRSDPADVPLYIRNAVGALEAMGAIYGQGTHAARPISTSGVPGKQGRLYYETDTQLLFWDYGTGWAQITSTYGGPGAGTIGTTELADNAVTNPKMADNSVGSAEIIDGTVGAAEIADALKPSAGAGAGTESLRSLGTTAGQAAAGQHTAQHSRTGADPLVIATFIGSGLLSARPSTGLVPGMVYTATDVNGGTSSMYNGSAWVPMAGAVSATGLATVATSVAGLGTGVAGAQGLLRLGSSPFSYIPLVYDATLSKWVSEERHFHNGGTNPNNDYSRVAQQINAGTAVLLGPVIPWTNYAGAGLKLQMRWIVLVQNENGSNGYVQPSIQALAQNASAGARTNVGAVINFSGNSIQVKGDMDPTTWRDVPGSIVTTDFLLPSIDFSTNVSPGNTTSDIRGWTLIYRWVSI